MGRGRSKLGGKATPGEGGGGGNNSPFQPNQVGLEAQQTLKQAIGSKGRKMSVEKAAVGANPYYKGGSKEYTENCQRCIVATELRMRGYDVVAKPTYEGDTLPTRAFKNQKTGNPYYRFTGAFKNARSQSVSNQNDFESKMKEYGSGSRAALTFGWKGQSYGHTINVVNQNGKIRYIDGQSGKYYNGKELWKSIKDGSASVTRLDNLKISDRAKKSVERSGRRKKGK